MIAILAIGIFSCFHKVNSILPKSVPPAETKDEFILPILPGAYHTLEYVPKLKGKKVGLVCNHTSLIDQTHLLDSLLSLGVNVVRIFVPEHGFRGEASAGSSIKDGVDARTGLPVISLYGKTKKPSADHLRNIEVLVFDLQDVGVRFYTYISTLHYVMEAASENSIPLIVLDRPNPNGHYIDGPVLQDSFKSFVGLHPIPVVYGLTIGELSQMIAGEKWISLRPDFSLSVVKCKNYKHQSIYHLPVKPSPNLPDMRSVWLYPGLCFFEGTQISLGRGTDSPFQIYGHPRMMKWDTAFTPKDRPGAMNPPHKDQKCLGFSCKNFNLDSLRNSKRIPIMPILKAYDLMPDSFFLKGNFFNLLAGTNEFKKQIQARKTEREIRQSWQAGLEKFKKLRAGYLLYPE